MYSLVNNIESKIINLSSDDTELINFVNKIRIE